MHSELLGLNQKFEFSVFIDYSDDKMSEQM